MPSQDKTIKALANAGLRDKVNVIIGGVSTSQRWCEQIGADGYRKNANEAVAAARKLIRRSKVRRDYEAQS